MAKHNPNYEYFPKLNRHGNPILDRSGNPVRTLEIKLYAPDGSVFRMPHGGDPANYVAKGYLIKPNADWQAKSAEYERAQAESIRISNAQREIRLKHQELQRRAEEKRIADEIAAAEAELAKMEAEMNGAPEPEEVEEHEAAPKAKAKAKPKA